AGEGSAGRGGARGPPAPLDLRAPPARKRRGGGGGGGPARALSARQNAATGARPPPVCALRAPASGQEPRGRAQSLTLPAKKKARRLATAGPETRSARGSG